MHRITLRTAVRLATIGAVAGCLLIATAMAVTYGFLQRAQEQVAFTGRLIENAARLNLLTAEILVHRSDRAIAQWSLQQDRLVHHLDVQPSFLAGAGVIANEIKQRLDSIRAIMPRLEKIAATGGPRPESREASEILRSSVIGHSNAVLARATELHGITTESAENTRGTVLASLGGVLLIVIVAASICLLVLCTGMLSHILRLRDTIHELGQGQLDVAIPAGGPNEIGEVFIELDRMRRNLLESMSEIGRANLELVGFRAKLEDRTASLEAANRELEAFISAVSHDLRAPLRTIMGFSQAALEDFGDGLGEEGRQMLGRIDRGARQMYALIEDLLRLSRIGQATLDVTDVDLTAMATELCQEFEQREPNRSVEVTIGPGMSAHCDTKLMRIALMNLLDNAWKFTSRNADTSIEIGCVRNNERIEFYVQDNGAGFDMAFSGNLFKPFKRLHSAADFPGTGIGLATVERIIRLHHGTVRATSVLDQGARFFFSLPRMNGARLNEASDADQHSSVPAGSVLDARPLRAGQAH
jgi:signal transduction histidine kinase